MRRLADMDEIELGDYFNALAAATESALPAGPARSGRCHFVLLVFDESCIGQYVSNAERSSMIKILRETADRIEANQDVPR